VLATPEPLVARLRAAGCVFAEDEAALLVAAAADPDGLERMVARRERGEPLEHVVGWAELAGVRVLVGPGVFVPRPRSAALVERAAAALREAGTRTVSPLSAPVLVDLCCGSGAVAVAVAARVPGAEVHAADVDPVAVGYARRNLAGFGEAWCGDLANALPPRLRGRVDVLVASPPYVPSGEVALLPRDARNHEPRVALDGGDDGLDLHGRIAADAAVWLAPGGLLLLETSARQGPAAARLIAAAGLTARVHHDEERDATVVEGAVDASADRTGSR